MRVDLRRLPSPDDLLILLTVARLGRFNAVAETLGTTHTTISRRILALDKQLGGRTLERSPHGWELTQLGASAVTAAETIEETLGSLSGLIRQDQHALSGLVRISTSDGFGSEFVTPALVRLQRQHPLLNVEMLSATRKVSQNRSGVDLEIVVGRTDVSNAQTIFLSNYYLRLYASPAYAGEFGLPETLDGVGQHCFVSYVESALQVAELGHRWSAQLPVPLPTNAGRIARCAAMHTPARRSVRLATYGPIISAPASNQGWSRLGLAHPLRAESRMWLPGTPVSAEMRPRASASHAPDGG